MKKPAYRTMWMFPRNIRFIAPWKLNQIASILYSTTGDPASQDVQDQLYDQLANLGVKIDRNPTGIANSGGMRTYFAQLACLGLFWRDATAWRTTIAGDELIAARDPLRVLRCQLMRMQYPSVYGLGPNVLISPEMKVRPFAFLVRLLMDSRLERRLSCDDMAVAVVYARTSKDYEKVVDKILKSRIFGIETVIDSLEDLCTPRRWKGTDEELFKKGVEDARTIGNTAKNYMEAAQLICPCSDSRDYELVSDESVLAEIELLLAEHMLPAPEAGFESSWQRRFGRFNKAKDTRRTCDDSRTDGKTALLQSRFIRAVEAAPYAFDLSSFCTQEAASWGMTVADVARIVDPLVTRVSSVERDTVMAAALSGGAQAITLEKASTAIFQRLGFDLSEHIGQKATQNRQGGYPDIRIRSSQLNVCGFGDSKATVRYVFPLSDTQKLASYYHDCDQEFEDRTPSGWFLYIAGGFGPSAKKVEQNLQTCSEKYGRPVSAITVNALLDLADMKEPPSVETLVEAFGKGRYYTSAATI